MSRTAFANLKQLGIKETYHLRNEHLDWVGTLRDNGEISGSTPADDPSLITIVATEEGTPIGKKETDFSVGNALFPKTGTH